MDRNNYKEVVDLLEVLYEDADSKIHIENKQQEMLGRFLFTISLLAINDRKRAEYQLPILQYLSDIFNSVGGNHMIGKIKGCF